MATAHQQSVVGGGRRSRILDRLFPWRSSSSPSRPSSSPSRVSRLVLPAESGSSSMRRTSPVDLHLGEPTNLCRPIPVPIPSKPGSPSLGISSDFERRRPLDMSMKAPQSTANTSTPDQLDRDELGTLRLLATDLHNALRLSEEENLLLKAKLQTMDEWGLLDDQHQQFVHQSRQSATEKLDRLIEELRDIASSQPTSPFASPMICRRNTRNLGRIMHQRQVELRRLNAELQQTQTELLFTQVELDQVKKSLKSVNHRLMYTEDELDLARQQLMQSSISKQRLMQELQTARSLLMRCWARVRVLEQQQSGQHQLELLGRS